ncbi:MAG: hypothetical protein GY847_21055 [Proteobacteria bacterium]|nr:hypothetical protein [Pseudomonadota bacterium]
MKKAIYITLAVLQTTFLIPTFLGAESNPVRHLDDDRAAVAVFSQKGGMLETGNHSVYLRTNDEWTGFSTLYLGYRYGFSDFFNLAVEGAASPIPHVYIGSVLLYFRNYESSSKSLFFGTRTRLGYRYQDSDFSGDKWVNIVGENYLTLKRNGVFFAVDLTIAYRPGKVKRHALYYSVYPRIDVDFVDNEERVHFLFSPVVLGYEYRFRRNPNFSFAIETGYAFPIPWNSIEEGRWVNFPSLGNIGFYFRW